MILNLRTAAIEDCVRLSWKNSVIGCEPCV